MKKKVFSIVLTLAMLVSMFSFFTVPAGALQEYQYVSPGDSINFPAYTYYYEVILTGFTRGEWYDIPLYIPHGSYVLVQSYGLSGAYAPAMILSDGTEVICGHSNGFKSQGYNGTQTLFQFHGPGGYTLSIKPSTSNDMRISFTLAENYFETTPPISTFDDIYDMEDGRLSCDWTPGMSAVIGRFTPPVTGFYTVITSGSPSMESYIIDPSSTELLADYPIPGETNGKLYLKSTVTYYVIMFIPNGSIPHDPTELYIQIGG